MEAWRHGSMGDEIEIFFDLAGYKFRISGLIIKKMADFRFQDLEIWKDSKDLSKGLFIIADKLKQGKYHSFSDQLFRATLSITNNIAEGSGSSSKKDFANYLIIARKSIFECANILIILNEFNLTEKKEIEMLVKSLMELSKKVYYFRKTLLAD
jgi:four helix bundle protein